MGIDLSKVGERERLKVRREPHWQRLYVGCYIGFRPSKIGGAGTWIARARDADAGDYRIRSLGDFGHLQPNERFVVAKREAEKFAAIIEAGGEIRRKIVTVFDACEDYLEKKPDKIAEGIFTRHVQDDPVAKVKLDKLRRHHLVEWRKRLEATPAIISRSKKGPARTKLRSKSTINRNMAPLRAALNMVLAQGMPNTDAAWQEALRPFKNAGKRREIYLDKAQRQSLLGNIRGDAEPFVKALCLLPLRPGAMAALSGTSAAMIERHYGHLVSGAAIKALAELAL